MKEKIIASDYIVRFLIDHGINHIFGFPGGMVTYLMDSLEKHKNQINAHVNYHEQAAAFCACSFGQIKNIPGVAYATSGPGATNLVTGIANAYYDSIPTIFITGQVKTTELMDGLQVRQKGFQEMDIAALVAPITKYAVRVMSAEDLRCQLEKAFSVAMGGRPGPVLLDIPLDVQREWVCPEELRGYAGETIAFDKKSICNELMGLLSHAKRPVIIAGNGINIANARQEFRNFCEMFKIPVVSSMIGVDAYFGDRYLGFIGAYGHRAANFAVAKSDLLITLGTRLDCRQTGENKENFCPTAEVFRIDIDPGEITNKVKATENAYIIDVKEFLNAIISYDAFAEFASDNSYVDWTKWCLDIQEKLGDRDDQESNRIIRRISKMIPDNAIITTDVGQNQVWVAQSFKVKGDQRVLFSGGHAAMGYSIPAGIGAYYASGQPIVCFVGDGGLQMNIQELKFIEREKLPIKIILLNNHSLGMIRHFQEMYFNSVYAQTKEGQGYANPHFDKIAEAYNIKYMKIEGLDEIDRLDENIFNDECSWLIEIMLDDNTYVYPKLAINKSFYDQEPPLGDELIESLLDCGEKE